jgi:hypothetical protein
MDDISRHIGVTRIVAGIGIPYPCGNPNVSSESDIELRRAITRAALKALGEGGADSTGSRPVSNIAVGESGRRAA